SADHPPDRFLSRGNETDGKRNEETAAGRNGLAWVRQDVWTGDGTEVCQWGAAGTSSSHETVPLADLGRKWLVLRCTILYLLVILLIRGCFSVFLPSLLSPSCSQILRAYEVHSVNTRNGLGYFELLSQGRGIRGIGTCSLVDSTCSMQKPPVHVYSNSGMGIRAGWLQR